MANKNESFRVIVFDKDKVICDIWENDFNWRKDKLSNSLCAAVKHAISVKPDGGTIEINTEF